MSEYRKGRPSPMKGKKLDRPDIAQASRERILKMYASGKFPKQSNTLPERMLREELLNRGYKEGIDFFHQYLFGGKFSIDFAFPKQKVLVEAHGDYWHANFGNKSWIVLHPIQVKNWQKDIAKRKYIAKYDNSTWKLIEIWESAIKKDVKSCVDNIVEALTRNQPTLI